MGAATRGRTRTLARRVAKRTEEEATILSERVTIAAEAIGFMLGCECLAAPMKAERVMAAFCRGELMGE